MKIGLDTPASAQIITGGLVQATPRRPNTVIALRTIVQSPGGKARCAAMPESDPAQVMVSDGLDKVKEAAVFLGVSVAYMYRLMERGELPFVKLGRSRRIPHRVVVELAARHLVRRPGWPE